MNNREIMETIKMTEIAVKALDRKKASDLSLAL